MEDEGDPPALLERGDHDLLDHRPQDRRCLLAGRCVGRERGLQVVDGLAVGIDRGRVQLDHLVALGGVHGGELGLELLLLGLQGLHAVGDREQADLAVHHLVDHGVEQALDLRQALLGDLPALARACSQPLHLRPVLGEEDRDRVGLEQLAADAVEHAPLDLGQPDRAAVAAVAALPVPAAGKLVVVPDRVAPAADPAAQQPGEQPLRPAPVRDAAERAVVGQDGPGDRPGLVVDDAQVRRLGADPVRFRPRPADAPSRFGVLHELGPIVDQPADIGFVVEDAAAAAAVAGDGAAGPGLAGGRGNAVAVEPRRDRLGAAPGCVLGEDAADHRGLPLHYLPLAPDWLATRVELAHDLVAVGEAAGRQALARPAGLTAPDLGRQVFQEERVHRALQPDMQLVDLALSDGDQRDASEAQSLVNGGDVFLVAAEAVERLGDHRVEQAGLGVPQQAIRLRPAAEMGARQRIVGIDPDRLAAQPPEVVTAQPDLVVDRALVLIVA